MKTIILGITGSIAAYKAAGIASQLVKNGHDVHCVMTQSGAEFITPLTLQVISRNPVLISLEDEKQAWKPGHIDLADRADLFLVAPATANTLGNFANGLAPDPLSSIYLATHAPVLIASYEWKNVATPRYSTQRRAARKRRLPIHWPRGRRYACLRILRSWETDGGIRHHY